MTDFVLDQLMLEKTSHPVLLTEPIANPEYCRTNLYEQMFECYGCPKVFLGVDALFSSYYHSKNLEEYQQRSRLIISIGYSTIHVIPVIKGTIAYNEIKRINVGVGNSWEILHKSLNFKYPHLKIYFDYFKTQAILMNICSISVNYKEQMEHFRRVRLR